MILKRNFVYFKPSIKQVIFSPFIVFIRLINIIIAFKRDNILIFRCIYLKRKRIHQIQWYIFFFKYPLYHTSHQESLQTVYSGS